MPTHGTHTNGTAYIRGTYSRVHIDTYDKSQTVHRLGGEGGGFKIRYLIYLGGFNCNRGHERANPCSVVL